MNSMSLMWLSVVGLLWLAIMSKSEAVEHIAKRGETLSSILQTYGIPPTYGTGSSMDRLFRENDEMLRQFPDNIEVGQVIMVPDDLIEKYQNRPARPSRTGEIRLDFVSQPAATQVESTLTTEEDLQLDQTIDALETGYLLSEESSLEKLGSDSPDDSKNSKKLAKNIDQEESAILPTLQSTQDSIDTRELVAAPAKAAAQSFQFGPVLSRVVFSKKLKENGHTVRDVRLVESDSSGFQVGFLTQPKAGYLASVDYLYSNVRFEKNKDLVFKQKTNTLQRLNTSLGWQANRLFSISAAFSLTEGLVSFDSAGVTVIRQNWSPAIGGKIRIGDKFSRDSCSWSLDIGVSHLPRQQLGDEVIKGGQQESISGALKSRIDYDSFLTIQLGHFKKTERFATGAQETNETFAAANFGFEL